MGNKTIVEYAAEIRSLKNQVLEFSKQQYYIKKNLLKEGAVFDLYQQDMKNGWDITTEMYEKAYTLEETLSVFEF